MKLELLTLCDFAKGEPTGKLYVIGVFDHVFAAEAPAPMPPSAIACRLRFDEVERGLHRVSVSFVDSDGAKVIQDMGAQLNVQHPPGEPSVVLNLVVILPPISLQRFGEYSIDLAVDARLEGSIPVFVRPSPPQPAAQT